MNSNSRRRRNRKTHETFRSKEGNSRDGKVNNKDQVEFQPTILRKLESINLDPTSNESEDRKKSSEANVKKVNPPQMKHSVALITKNHLEPILLSEFLDLENANFYVVGVIGMKDSGKSTVLNLIATGKLHRCSVNQNSTVQDPLFNKFPHGNGVEAFITESRVILLDSAPVLYNTHNREFIISETDDIRQVQAMFRMCNELIVVYESHQVLSLIRMLIFAKNMMKPYECDEPEITLIENRVQPGSEKNPVTDVAISLLNLNNISDSVTSISVPDFDSQAPYHGEPLETIQQLRDDINIRKELKMYEDPLETEKTWWEKVSKMSMDGGHFLSKLEGLREKYYQRNENFYFPQK